MEFSKQDRILEIFFRALRGEGLSVQKLSDEYNRITVDSFIEFNQHFSLQTVSAVAQRQLHIYYSYTIISKEYQQYYIVILYIPAFCLKKSYNTKKL